MRILIATDNYAPRYDGISRFLQEIIPALAAKHEVRVVAPDFGPTSDRWPVTKIPVLRWRIGDFHPAGLHLLKVLGQVRKADVVFLQALGPIGTSALLAAKLLRRKIVLYTHSIEWELVPRALRGRTLRGLLPSLLKATDRLAYRWIDLLIVPSQGVSETYYWNRIETRRRVVHLGVDTGKFAPPRSRRKAKEALGIPKETLVIGYHGRLAREKDLRTLLRGYLRFKAKHRDTPMLLLIVGDGLREIRDMLTRDDVRVTGFQEDVVQFLQAMDIYALSSLTETSCLSVMEAMSCGLAVASTPVGYVKDYITNGRNGLLYPEGDSAALAAHLEELLDAKVRARLGRNARRTMRERFSWDKTREAILTVFDQL